MAGPPTRMLMRNANSFQEADFELCWLQIAIIAGFLRGKTTSMPSSMSKVILCTFWRSNGFPDGLGSYTCHTPLIVCMASDSWTPADIQLRLIQCNVIFRISIASQVHSLISLPIFSPTQNRFQSIEHVLAWWNQFFQVYCKCVIFLGGLY